MLVSLVMPVYNEIRTLSEILKRCVEVDFPKEIIIIDDCSKDGSREFLSELETKGISLLGAKPKNQNTFKIIFQETNQGKGSALKRGFAETTGDIVLVQDADLEYDPKDILHVIKPIQDGIADVVFGSRFIGDTRRVLYYWHTVLNNMLTTLSNMTTGLNLTDMETCYKAFRAEVIRGINLEEKRFGIEPELTAKVAHGNWRVYEVPISYFGRTYEEGKKIGWKDGVRALYAITKYAVKR